MNATLNIFENAGDGAWAVDADQRIVFWNKAAEELLGFREEDVLGKKCWRFFAGRDLAGKLICRDKCPIQAKCLRNEPISSFDLATSHHDGRVVKINVSTLFIPQEGGADKMEHGRLVHFFRLMNDALSVQDGLRICLLGTTSVTRVSSMPVRGPMWRRTKVRALLAYLILHRGMRIGSDSLIRSFWPELPDKSAHHNLNTTVYYLRRSLEPSLERGSDSRFVGYENNHYFLLSDPSHQIDIELFESGLNDARHKTERKRAVTLYRDALRYYRGDFQTDVNSIWPWHQSERTRLRSLYSAALEELALLHEQLRQEVEAIEVYTRLLTFQPWHENTCRRLMRLHLKLGEPETAISHYQTMAQALLEDLAETPREETRQLYDLASTTV